jgi:hypothetical protein
MGCQRGASFDAWFARACALEPAARFGTCAEQVEALASSLVGAPFVWRRRSRLSSRVLGLGAVAGAFGVAAIVWGVSRERTTAPRGNTAGFAAAPAPAPVPVAATGAPTPPEAVPPAASPPDAGLAQAPPATRDSPARRRRPATAKTTAATAGAAPARPLKDRVWEEP